MTRIATLAQHNLLLANVLNTQARISQGQLQIGTGQKAQVYSGLAIDVNRLLNAKELSDKATQYADNIGVVQQRLTLMDKAVGQIGSVIRDFKNDIQGSRNDLTTQGSRLQSDAITKMQFLADLLNSKDGTRALFGGTNLAGPATTFNAGTNTVDNLTNVTGTDAQGRVAALAIKSDDTTSVRYDATAREAPFENALRGLEAIANGAPLTQAIIDTALTFFENALNGTALGPSFQDIQVRLGSANQFLEADRQKHVQFLNYAGDVISSIQNINPAEIIAKVNKDQVQLEASYQSLARLSELSLLNFLR